VPALLARTGGESGVVKAGSNEARATHEKREWSAYFTSTISYTKYSVTFR